MSVILPQHSLLDFSVKYETPDVVPVMMWVRLRCDLKRLNVARDPQSDFLWIVDISIYEIRSIRVPDIPLYLCLFVMEI